VKVWKALVARLVTLGVRLNRLLKEMINSYVDFLEFSSFGWMVLSNFRLLVFLLKENFFLRLGNAFLLDWAWSFFCLFDHCWAFLNVEVKSSKLVRVVWLDGVVHLRFQDTLKFLGVLPCFFVLCELPLLLERDPANFAFVRSVVRVSPKVVFHIAILVKIFAAVVAVV